MTQARTSSGRLKAITDVDVLAALRELGNAWDCGLQVEVSDEGVVLPSVTLPKTEHEESRDVRRRRTGTGSRSQARPAVAAHKGSRRDVRKVYEAELPALREAYPGLRIWPEPQGMWIEVESPILRNLNRRATFLVIVPFSRAHHPRAWAYWGADGELAWIGPRHTNLPDGSICAFGLEDGTWSPGDSLIMLFSIYFEWVAKHLFLEVFNRWPGQQHDLGPYYRLVEFKSNEICSCGSHVLYEECCRYIDLLHCIDLGKSAKAFEYLHNCALNARNPPNGVDQFLNRFRNSPPSMSSIAGLSNI